MTFLRDKIAAGGESFRTRYRFVRAAARRPQAPFFPPLSLSLARSPALFLSLDDKNKFVESSPVRANNSRSSESRNSKAATEERPLTPAELLRRRRYVFGESTV